MSEFRAVSLDGEVTLTSPNGKFVFPSHRKHEVRTYKITFTDDVGNSGFTYYAQAPFTGTDLSISAAIFDDIRHIDGLPTAFTYQFGYNTSTRLLELQPGSVLHVGITVNGGDDVIPDDIDESVLWVTDKNGNRVGGSPSVVVYASPWGTTTIAGAIFNLNGQPSMPYENYTTEQKNNATYTLHIMTTPTTEYTRQFLLVDGQDYIKCFGASTNGSCSWEYPCCIDDYNMTEYGYVEVSCPDPRSETGSRSVYAYSSTYGDNCVIVAADGLTVLSENSYISFNGIMETPHGTQEVIIQGGSTSSHITYYGSRYVTMSFGVYKSDSSGNILNNNPIYTWSQNFNINDYCESGYCTNYDKHFLYIGPGYVSGGAAGFINAIKSNFGGSDEYYAVVSPIGVTPSVKSKVFKAKKVNPCAGLDTSTRDKYKIKLTAGDKVYSQTSPLYYDIYTYNSTSNGLVNISSGSSSYNISYSTFTASYGGYAIFDNDGSGRPATTTDRQNITVNVGDTTRYSGDNFAETYIVTRIQANGTVTICEYYSFRNNDNPPMITTTGSEIGDY